MPESSPNPIWNLPLKQADRDARSPASLLPALESHFGDRPVRALEIGVFQGGFAKRLHGSSLNVVSYDGIDPFSGAADDPYSNSEHYWMNESEADQTYRNSHTLLQSFGYRLHRKTSRAFFSDELASDQTFDLIHLDGDHRYHQALFDIRMSFSILEDEGILAIDDYANADTPEVTWAFDVFHRDNESHFQRIGYVSNRFQPSTKPAPMSQVTVYLEPVPRTERQNTESAGRILKEMESRVGTSTSFADKLLDISPRKVFRRLFGK